MRDDDGGALEVLELGMREFAIDLGQRFFAAHGEHGMAEGDHDTENAELLRQALIGKAVMEEAERFFGEMQVSGRGQRDVLVADFEERERRPAEQDHNHHGRDLHDPERLFAGLVDALDVLPPVIDGDGEGEDNRGPVDVELRRAVENVVNGARNPAVRVGGDHDFVEQADDVLAGGHAGDRAGENVVEHQRGDAELGQRAAEGFFDDFVDAAAHEHRAAFDVDGAHRKREEHDSDNEPGGGFADGLLGDAAGIKGRRSQIVENDGGRAPVGDEGQHHRRGDDDANAVGRTRYGLEGR